jgi:hypothetical protein
MARQTVVGDRLPRRRVGDERASNVPMRTPIESGWLRLRPKIDEPQSLQNHFSPPSSGFQSLSRSSPLTM